jgi:hypothetical protein
MPNQKNIRQVLLEVIADQVKANTGPLAGSLNQQTTLDEADRRIGVYQRGNFDLLTVWYDLFREGYLSWGYNLSNPSPPRYHLTDRGNSALERISRDPANPEGYLAYLNSKTKLNPIAKSYIIEAISTYTAMCFKASAVMIGGASESLILELRDTLKARLQVLGRPGVKDLDQWQIKKVLNGLVTELDPHKKAMGSKLSGAYEAYWPAFTQPIRAARNDAGHPSSIDPISLETVHANLLIFPELASLAENLRDWISSQMM